MKIDGDIAYTDKFGKRHTIEGYGTLPDETELKSLKVDGSISFDKISCGNFKVNGDCFGSSLTAEKISVDGDIEVNDIKAVEDLKIYGDCAADLLTANKIFIDGDVKADGIKVAESLNIEGEPQINSIESDKVVINTRFGTVEEIKCRDLKIFYSGVNFEGEISIGKFRIKSSPKQNFSQVLIKKIDAINVELENCKVSQVECKNAIINANCSIDKLIVSGNLEIDNNSKINSIVRE